VLECTVKEASKQQWGGYGIYLFRHNKTGRVLYVGQSCCPTIRLRQHTHPGSKLKFDKFLVEHMPEALDWLAEIYHVTECDWLVRNYRPGDYEVYQRCLLEYTLVHNSVIIAEAAMIAHCKPPHNYSHKSKEVS
jgi:hypothetical protein